MAVTIRRHCVASMPDSGLSPLQEALLKDPHPVRIASAPTGAGKTYAFEQAVAGSLSLEDEIRVLFVVPTKRLAQNILHGLTTSLIRNHGWPESRANSKVALWTGDATQDYYAAGGQEITSRRINQIYRLDDAPGGEMIVTVPEVLSYLLIGRWLKAGQASEGIFTILNQFDHIVFDEFHTISARGFGLAALCARLAAGTDGRKYGRARVSFLSATPLKIRPVLERSGLAPDMIVELREQISQQGRAVHGDVVLTPCPDADLTAMLASRIELVRRELAGGGQTVLIYDSLADLRRQLPSLENVLQKAGVQSGETLLINSIDDSVSHTETKKGAQGFFQSGRRLIPLDFKVLVATASVEMGVTFKTRLLFMEPGFEPMNFLQRYGRAARGDVKGQVFVRMDETACKRRPWLRQVDKWLQKHDGEHREIKDLTTLLAASSCQRFMDEPAEQNFGSLSLRAVYTSGLYWNAAQQHPSNKGSIGKHLGACRPRAAKTISLLLSRVRELTEDPYYAEPAEEWCKGFAAQAATLRDIGQRITVVEENGRRLSVELHWLRRETDLLEQNPITLDSSGKEELHIAGSLDDNLLESSQYIQRLRTVCFPHTDLRAKLEDDGFLPDQWRRELRNHREAAEAWEDFPEAMAAAEKLVLYTGLVVTDDEEIPMDANSLVL